MNDNFSRMGANSFDIRPGTNGNLHGNNRGREEKRADPINFRQPWILKNATTIPSAKVSVSGLGKWDAIVKNGKEKTNPTCFNLRRG
jgi:hypothetical protein